MIDPASGGLKNINNDKRAITIANIAEQEWFAWYPWPTHITFDRSNEFNKHAFKHMVMHNYGIKCKSVTVRKIQANTIVEWIHWAIGNIIRTFELETYYLD